VLGDDGYSAVGDMDGDGNIDIVTNSVDKIYIYYHNGTLPIELKSISIVPTSSYRAQISLADMDGDGDLDILAARNNKLVIITNKSTPGKFVFEVVSLPIEFTTNYPELIGEDFDKDGNVDILVRDLTGRIKVFYNRIDTYLEYNVDYIIPAPVEANVNVVKLADFNNDGLLDIVAGSLFADKKGLMVYFNEGQSFKPFVIAEKHDYRDLQVVDFDKDGDIDILISGEQGVTKYQIDLWINDIKLNNKFELKNLLKRQWSFSGINVLDIDNDGALDLIVGLSHHSNDLPGGLSLFKSNGDFNNLNFTEFKVLDFPQQSTLETILLADFDNDGDQDFFHSTINIWVENKFKTTSIIKNQFLQKTLFFPNPVNDIITINHNSRANLKIYNSAGVLMIEKWINPEDQIDVKNLSSGIYFGTITNTSDTPRLVKFIKQ
jgi:hypothetical protein